MEKAHFFDFGNTSFQPLNATVSSRMIAGAKLMYVEHQVKKGHISLEESHENEQLTLVLRGSLRFTVGDAVHYLKEGDALLIPAHVVHSCEVIEESRVIEVFSPPRREWLSNSVKLEER